MTESATSLFIAPRILADEERQAVAEGVPLASSTPGFSSRSPAAILKSGHAVVEVIRIVDLEICLRNDDPL
jgi:hypothetical protein